MNFDIKSPANTIKKIIIKTTDLQTLRFTGMQNYRWQKALDYNHAETRGSQKKKKLELDALLS